MNILRKISLFFIIMCIGQLISLEATQPRNEQRRNTQRGQRNSRQRTNSKQEQSYKKASAARYNSQVNNPAALGAAAEAHNNNEEQQKEIDAYQLLLLEFCHNNPSDVQCVNQSASTTTQS